ncbi:MAG TPA: SLC13 family permease [Galbitalea sp.]
MRVGLIGAVLLAIGLVAVAFGVIPISDAIGIADRVWPILLFVVAITVLAELAATAGLFRFIAEQLARWGLRRAWLLWLLVVTLAAVSTIFLSLDTTAVLLTPVVIAVARHVGLRPMPFALTTVWLANCASLLLPVSNLTNLLAADKLPNESPLYFASLMAVPALVAIVVPCVALFVLYRRELLVRFDHADRTPPEDRVLFVLAAVVVTITVPALVSGIPVWIPALAGAVTLAIGFLARNRAVLKFSLIPWQLVLFASGLFLVVEVARGWGLGVLLEAIVGHGDDVGSLERIAGVGAASANLVNNLPAYLALEPTAGSPLRLAALLIGVNAGSLITPWASLATLLWHDRLASLGVTVSWGRFALAGLVVAPLTVGLAVLALAFWG